MTQLYSVDICDYGNVLTTPLPVQEVSMADVLEYYKLCPLTPQLLGCVCVGGGVGDGQRYRGQASVHLYYYR